MDGPAGRGKWIVTGDAQAWLMEERRAWLAAWPVPGQGYSGSQAASPENRRCIDKVHVMHLVEVGFVVALV